MQGKTLKIIRECGILIYNAKEVVNETFISYTDPFRFYFLFFR
jgi:hypothetical protein